MDGHLHRLVLLEKCEKRRPPSMISPITSHVLDTSLGKPAAGVPITLDFCDGSKWINLGNSITNQDGRLSTPLITSDLTIGLYRIIFDTESYFAAASSTSFYPEVSVVFRVEDAQQHYHIPLLLSPFGYSTYRGS